MRSVSSQLPKSIFNRVIAGVTSRGINVCFQSASESEWKGNVDRDKLVISSDTTNSVSTMFLVAHVFGHCIQFAKPNTFGELLKVAETPPPIKLPVGFKEEFFEYEKEAFGIGLSLLNEAFLLDHDLRKLYSAYFLADFAVFMKYLTSGDRVADIQFHKSVDVQAMTVAASTVEAVEIPSDVVLSTDVNIRVI